MTERACFELKLKDGAAAEYIQRHREVWPEMLAALRESGWTNYSIYLSTSGNTVIGYFEADQTSAAVEAMAKLEVNARWQASSAHLFDGDLHWMPEVFHLEEELSATPDQSRQAPDARWITAAAAADTPSPTDDK